MIRLVLALCLVCLTVTSLRERNLYLHFGASDLVRRDFCDAYLRWVQEFAAPGEADGLTTLNLLCDGHVYRRRS